MSLDANVMLELFKVGLMATITVLGLILAWLFRLKFTTMEYRQNQKELDLTAVEQFGTAPGNESIDRTSTR